MSKITLRNETPLIGIIDRPILPLKKEKFGKIKGILIGCFLAGLFIVFGLLARRVFRDILI
jgi:hypothetical protein